MCRNLDDGILDCSVEQHPSMLGRASVKPEGEFFKIGWEMLPGNPSVMNSKKPSFQQRSDTVHPRQQSFRRLLALPGQYRGTVSVAKHLKAIVAPSPISQHFRSGFYHSLNELFQALCIVARDILESYATGSRSSYFYSCHDHGLGSLGAKTTAASLTAPDNDLIDFHLPGQKFAFWPYHGTTQLVEAVPSRLVAAQSKNSLQSQGADPSLLACDPPDRPEPESKRKVTALKNSACRDGDVHPASPTVPEATACFPSLAVGAARASEPRRPPNVGEIVFARLFGSEPMFEFEQGSWIKHCHWHIL